MDQSSPATTTTAAITADDIWRVLEPLGYTKEQDHAGCANFRSPSRFLIAFFNQSGEFLTGTFTKSQYPEVAPALAALAHLLSPTDGGDQTEGE